MKQFTEKLSKAGCKVVKINPTDFDFMSAWQTHGKIIDMKLGILNTILRSFSPMLILLGLIDLATPR